MKPWLRWILVIPAAIGAYAGVQIAIAIMSLIGDFFWETGSARWTQLINSAAGPAAFVWYGSKTAPVHRFITSISLTVLLAIAMSVLATLVFSHGIGTKWENVWLVVCGVIGVVSSIIACYSIHEEEQNEIKAREWAAENEPERKEFQPERAKSDNDMFSKN